MCVVKLPLTPQRLHLTAAVQTVKHSYTHTSAMHHRNRIINCRAPCFPETAFRLGLYLIIPRNRLLITRRHLTRTLSFPLPTLLLPLMLQPLCFRLRLRPNLRRPHPLHSPIPTILIRILLLLRHEARIIIVPAITYIIVRDVLVLEIAEGFVSAGGVFFRVFGDDVPGVEEAGDVAEHAEEDVN